MLYYLILEALMTFVMIVEPCVAEGERVQRDFIKQVSGSEMQDSSFADLVGNAISQNQANYVQHQTIIDNAKKSYDDHITRLKQDSSSNDSTILGQVLQNRLSDDQSSYNKAVGLCSRTESKVLLHRPTALIFVSFSMPTELLWSYMNQAKHYNAKLVIRGLVNNSFKDTVKVMDLGDNKILKLEINPKLFKEHKITRVPTIVVLDENNETSSKFIGSVSLNYIVDEIDKKFKRGT